VAWEILLEDEKLPRKLLLVAISVVDGMMASKLGVLGRNGELELIGNVPR
jgi:hypothetical protein